MRRALLVLTLLLAAGFSGCLEPYRPVVDPAALNAISPAWEEIRAEPTSGGMFGPNTVETKYRHLAEGNGPPFPGILQVFGIRELEPRSTDELLAWTEDIVERALARENITVDDDTRRNGERALKSGLATRWFTMEGEVAAAGNLFAEDVVVRVIGEVGRDGVSNTGFVAVGLAQVSRDVRNPVCTGPVLPTCEDDIRRQTDFATWRSIVGDEAGTIDDAVDTNALLWNLMTHG